MLDNNESLNLDLKNYKDRLSIALKAANICIFEVDIENQLYTFFENSEAIFGISGDKILKDVQAYSNLSSLEYQKAVSEYFSHPDDFKEIEKAFKLILEGKSASYQARMKAGSTEYIWCRIDVTPICKDDEPMKMIGIISNIHEMKQRMNMLEKTAYLDNFTGLYSKKRFEEMVKVFLKLNPNNKAALLMIDLDNFKVINDTFGHVIGDEVLFSVAQNLKSFFRRTDIISRFGGDEFVVLMSDIQNVEDICIKLDKFFCIEDNEYRVTKSIGISIFPDMANNYEDLLNNADIALYKAKQTKNCYIVYNEKEVLMDILKAKKELRSKIKEIKSLMSKSGIEESDKLIESNLMKQSEIIESKTIFCFVSMKDEINTKCIIKKLLDMGKIIGVPKCEKDNTMNVYQIESLDDLEIGAYNIDEPKEYCKKIESKDIDLALIPATACDSKRNRIGKGAGYYDRYLRNQKFLKIALCRQKFIVDSIPVEENDICMDKIITEKNIY